MLNQADIDWLKDVFVTKDDLRQFKNDIFNKLDAFITDIVAKRQEQTLHVGQHTEINDRLERHHRRLASLEKHSKLPVAADD